MWESALRESAKIVEKEREDLAMYIRKLPNLNRDDHLSHLYNKLFGVATPT